MIFKTLFFTAALALFAASGPSFAQDQGQGGEHGSPITAPPGGIEGGSTTGTVDSSQIGDLAESPADDSSVVVAWPAVEDCPPSAPFGNYPDCKTLCEFNPSHPTCVPATCPPSAPYGTPPNCMDLCTFNPSHPSCTGGGGGGSDYWVRLRVDGAGTVSPNSDQLWENTPESFVGAPEPGGTADAESDCMTWAFDSSSGELEVSAVNTGEADNECFVDFYFSPPFNQPSPDDVRCLARFGDSVPSSPSVWWNWPSGINAQGVGSTFCTLQGALGGPGQSSPSDAKGNWSVAFAVNTGGLGWSVSWSNADCVVGQVGMYSVCTLENMNFSVWPSDGDPPDVNATASVHWDDGTPAGANTVFHFTGRNSMCWKGGANAEVGCGEGGPSFP